MQVKKAYLKAVRLIHPDKLPESLAVEQEMLSQVSGEGRGI